MTMASVHMSSSIPLNCTLCPKQPVFSDLSHLLTHLNSKGHLAVEKHQSLLAIDDPVQAAIYQNYQAFYNNWNISALLAERLRNKEKKVKGKASNSRSTTRSSSLGTGRIASRALDRTASLARSVSFQSPIARSLTALPLNYGTNIKREPSSSPWTPYQTIPQRYGQPYMLHNNNIPRVYDYADSPYASDYSGPSNYPEPPHDYDLVKSESEQEEPARTRQRRSGHVEVQDDSDDGLPCAANDAEDDDTSQAAKLKGTVWPGMSMFDSATPAARKQRNQKKAANVIEQLETNSLSVESCESVWYPDGSLKKQKEISGFPSSSSPPQSPSISAVADANLTAADLRQLTHDSNVNSPYPRAGVFNAHEVAQTHTNRARRPKRTFEAYRDDEDEEYGGHQPLATFARPSNMSHLTRGLPFQHVTGTTSPQLGRPRMPGGRSLDNRLYENMPPVMPSLHGKSPYPSPQMMYHNLPRAAGNARQALANAPMSRSRDTSYSPRPSPHATTTRALPSPLSHANSAYPQQVAQASLRGVGAQFAEVYNNPTIFTGHSPAMHRHSHGQRGRRSVSGIPIEDLVHNYSPASSPYLSREQIQHMHYMNNPQHVYDPAMSVPPNQAADYHNAWAALQQHNDQIIAGWTAQASNAAPNSVSGHVQATASATKYSLPDVGHNVAGSAGRDSPAAQQHMRHMPELTMTDTGNPSKTISEHAGSTPAAATEDEGRTITAPPSSPCL